jgi:N-acetyl sugar amidotransferase
MKNIPLVTWCTKCVYPSSSAVPLTFDESGICIGCITAEEKKSIDWLKRKKLLLKIIEPYRKSSGYECIIPVSGGKDSYYQTHFVINELKLKPLLVTYNGNNFLKEGWENLQNMKNIFNTDHMIISPSVDVLIRMNRAGFLKCGDMNWHNHAGIFTTPIQVAINYKIPLMFWGEHGWTEVGGMLSNYDFPEFTYRYRLDQNLRGYDWPDFLNDKIENIKENELELYKYPSDESVRKVGLRGLHIGSYDKWDTEKNTDLMKKKYGWIERKKPFDRTYRKTSNLDDMYENGVHDYMKYIKFGYGRATDHASKDIRAGRITRAQGVEMVKKYDHVVPSDLAYWLNYVSKDEKWFYKIANKFRSKKVWLKEKDKWIKMNIK